MIGDATRSDGRWTGGGEGMCSIFKCSLIRLSCLDKSLIRTMQKKKPAAPMMHAMRKKSFRFSLLPIRKGIEKKIPALGGGRTKSCPTDCTRNE